MSRSKVMSQLSVRCLHVYCRHNHQPFAMSTKGGKGQRTIGSYVEYARCKTKQLFLNFELMSRFVLFVFFLLVSLLFRVSAHSEIKSCVRTVPNPRLKKVSDTKTCAHIVLYCSITEAMFGAADSEPNLIVISGSLKCRNMNACFSERELTKLSDFAN